MIKEAISQVVKGESLDLETAKTVMNEIMDGEATNAQIASLLTAMMMKGEGNARQEEWHLRSGIILLIRGIRL